MPALKFLLFGTATILGFLVLASVLVVFATMDAVASSGVTDTSPSDEARNDIPPMVLQAYIEAADQCAGLPWPIIAGIGKVESDHGRFGGATLGSDLIFRPPIIGIPLDGRPGVALITDTDNGRLDGDSVYDRAVGPFQFIPTTWALFEGSIGEQRDPHYLPHGVQAVVWHLCPQGTLTNIDGAIFNYNRSQAYVDKVTSWAERYTGESSGIPIAGYALPLPGITQQRAAASHHDYPAWDMGVPVGTPVFAMTSGEVIAADGTQPVYTPGQSRCGNLVIIQGTDQVRYTYCHLNSVTVTVGQTVAAGQQIGDSGGQPGSPGAGNTTGPHLHLGLRGAGRSLCPQQLLRSIIDASPINPLTLPSTGCIS